MNRTGIEWVLNPDGSQGYSCNSKTGCVNHTPEGLCLGGDFPCYAYKLAHGRQSQRYLANDNIAPLLMRAGKRVYRLATEKGIVSKDEVLADPFYPRFWPGHLEQIRQHKKPAGIFLDDMSDWMGDYWPEEWTRQELQVMRDCPRHRFYTLTKQPQNLPKFSPFPPNCWVGITATNRTALVTAINNCQFFEASIKFASFEPLLGEIGDALQYITAFQWVIIGACTGTLNELKPLALKYPELSLMPYGVHDPELPFTRGKKWTLQPKTEWVQKIALACTKAHISLFLKDNLRPLLPNRMPFYDVYCWWSDDKTHQLCENRLRQEIPQEAK